MKNRLLICAVVAFLIGTLVTASSAGVSVQRTGSENPVLEVSRSIIYGGLAGLIVGSAIGLASNNGEAVKWGFVGGTIVGGIAGIYFVSTRPQPEALLEIENGRPKLGTLAPTVSAEGSTQLHLVAFRF
jgi:hypothetical protein